MLFGNIWRKPTDVSTASSSGSPATSGEPETKSSPSVKMATTSSDVHRSIHAAHSGHEMLRDLQQRQSELFERIGETASDIKNLRRGLNDYSVQLDGKITMLVQELTELRHDIRMSSEANASFIASAEKRLDDLEKSRTYLMGVLRSLRWIGGIISAAAAIIASLLARMFLFGGVD